VRQRRELKGGEVAVSEPALLGRGQRVEIEPVEQPRPAVAAPHGNGELDARVSRHPPHGREPRIIGSRNTLPARGAGRIDDDPVAERLEPRDRAVHRGRLGREAGGGVQADAVVGATMGRVSAAAKKSASSFRIRRRHAPTVA
jgi:hypothetical protein